MLLDLPGMALMSCFSVLHRPLPFLRLVPQSEKGIESAKFVYLMGADDVNLDKIPNDAFVVYQGHHGDECLLWQCHFASSIIQREGRNIQKY